MQHTSEFTFVTTLCDLVKNDGLSVGDAIKMFRDEFKVGLVYCNAVGIIERLRKAETERTR